MNPAYGQVNLKIEASQIGKTFLYSDQPIRYFDKLNLALIHQGIRLDKVPYLADALNSNQYQGGLVITKTLGQYQMASIQDFVKKGGKLYVVLGNVPDDDKSSFNQYFHLGVNQEVVVNQYTFQDGSVLFSGWRGLVVGLNDHPCCPTIVYRTENYFTVPPENGFITSTVTSYQSGQDRIITVEEQIGKGDVFFTTDTSVWGYDCSDCTPGRIPFSIFEDAFISENDNMKASRILFDWLSTNPSAAQTENNYPAIPEFQETVRMIFVAVVSSVVLFSFLIRQRQRKLVLME